MTSAGWTIARSRPASTQWWRNTELSTRAGVGRDAERHVGDAQRGLDVRDVLLDQLDALDRLDGRRAPLLVAGGEREGERVEDQELRVEPVLVADQVLDALGDLELAVARLGHADLVDGERDQRRAVGLGERHDGVELVAARPPGSPSSRSRGRGSARARASSLRARWSRPGSARAATATRAWPARASARPRPRAR